MREFQVNFNQTPILPPYTYRQDEADLPVLRNLIERRNAYADTVNRETQAYKLEDPELQTIVTEGITLEQIDVLDSLQKAYEDVPLQEFLEAHTAATLLAAELRNKTINDLVGTDTFTELDQLAEKAATLAPTMRAKILSVIETRKIKLIDDSLRSTVVEHAFVQEELSRATARIMQAYEGWPVSQTARLSQKLASTAIDDMSTQLVSDGEVLDNPEIEEELYGVEAQIADVLSLFPNDQIDLEELVHFFEGHDTFDTNNSQRRKQIIDLFRGESGQQIAELLQQKDILLLHGWTLISDKNGIARQRILRTLPTNTSLETVDEIVTAADKQTSTTTIWGIDIDADLQEEIEHQPIDTVNREPSLESPEPQEQKAQGKSWETNMKLAIGEAIAKLEDMSLLTTEELVGRGKIAAARQGAHRIMGTETNVRRLVEAKLLPRRALDTTNYEFNPAELVLMMMYNTSRDMLRQHSQKKDAVELVENILSSYFARKEERRSKQ